MKIYLQQRLPSRESFHVRDEFWEHYLESVRRVGKGDFLEVVGDEEVARCRVASVDPLAVEVESTRPRRGPSHRLWVAQALTRKKKFEQLVKQGAELGVTDFLPMVSEHTVRRPNQPEKQRDRWRRISLDSTRISGRDWTPRIHELLDFTSALDRLAEVPDRYWGDPEGGRTGEVFAGGGVNAALIVGPEGGFSAEERRALASRCEAVSLGSSNFRSETASIVLSVLWLQRQGVVG